MTSNKVSVIIPAFNEEKYIESAVRSALEQTHDNLEVIVIDDGSNDNTRNVIYSIKDKRVFYHYQKNASQAVARNNGISKSTGDFLAFLDADDYWESSKISLQLKTFENEDVGLCHTNITKVYRGFHEIQVNEGSQENILFANYISNSSVMVRKSLLNKLHLEFRKGIQGVEDWDMWLRLSLACKFEFIDEPLCFYRIHENNISGNLEKMLKGIYSVLDHCLEFSYFEVDKIENSKYLHTIRYAHYAMIAGDKKLARRFAMYAFKIKPFSYRPLWAYLKSFRK